MATVKRLSGDYSIVTVGSDDNVNIQTRTVNIDGNLNVVGNVQFVGSITDIQVQEATISDPIITVGAGNDGLFTALGIEVVKNQSLGSKAGLRWNTLSDHWEISKDNIVWHPIGASGLLIDDPSPTLSAPLNTNNQAITGPNDVTISPTSTIVNINASLKLPHQTLAPAAAVDYTIVYAQAMKEGGTALYVSTYDSALNEVKDELVSKSKAIIYSIIF